jgi:hypothetical protein
MITEYKALSCCPDFLPYPVQECSEMVPISRKFVIKIHVKQSYRERGKGNRFFKVFKSYIPALPTQLLRSKYVSII